MWVEQEVARHGHRHVVQAFRASLSISEVLPAIFLCTAHPLVLGSSFMRLQEHYESPDETLRGHPFRELAAYHALTARVEKTKYGTGFDFYLHWPGFNLPSRVLEAARRGSCGDLRPMEEALLSLVKEACEAAGCALTRPYYLIGACADNDVETVRHEMAHGLWSTNAAYQEEVLCCLDEIAAADQAIMREELMRSGYCGVDAIIRDEMQAYMAGNNNLLGADAVAVAPVAKRIRGIFDAYRAAGKRKLMQAADDAGRKDGANAGGHGRPQILEARLTVLDAARVCFRVTLV